MATLPTARHPKGNGEAGTFIGKDGAVSALTRP